ncbi:hypothetical protein FCL49_11025 [Serratia proteamaculans]|uniref:hypothetical protein n=1 Tax=Serratia proteamaculans TaxID=28151 RepID=UPI0015776FF7|nr:hypothetical protein [Serratia proteamaculans]NTX79431.1 hypothetical protein [Serratia proteamaculans]NTZ28633.1 hypothetical protein [Serratia proteamaculans]
MNLKEVSEKICKALISSSYIDEASKIKTLVDKVLTLDKNDNIRTAAIEELISRCHPKWLGDYYIKNTTYKEWTDLITDLKIRLNKIK